VLQLGAPLLDHGRFHGHERRDQFKDHRLVVHGSISRQRVGNPPSDLPDHFGSKSTEWKGLRRYAADSTWNIGSWNTVLAVLPGQAESRGLIDRGVSVDSTINRAHQHRTSPRAAQGSVSIDKKVLGEPPDAPSARPAAGRGPRSIVWWRGSSAGW
jgi:transposase